MDILLSSSVKICFTKKEQFVTDLDTYTNQSSAVVVILTSSSHD